MPAFLLSIAQVPCLANNLVLKGGAALRHYYQPKGRLSNDMDYSALSQLPQGEELTAAVQEVAQRANKLLGTSLTVMSYSVEVERSFKPVPMRSFQFFYEWKPSQDVRIGLDISLDEPIVRPPQQLPLLAPGFLRDVGVTKSLVYSLDEIAAEKLRALLQWTRQLKEKGRRDMPVARTYFDLHYLLMRRPEEVVRPGFVELLQEKCRVRGVSFSSAASFFDAELVDVARANWGRQLFAVAAAPLQADELLDDLQRLVEDLIF